MIKGIVVGCWLMAAIVGLCFTSYKAGYSDGTNNVITECAYYRKYGIDGTQYLLCSAIMKPGDLMPEPKEFVYDRDGKYKKPRGKK